MNPTERTLLAIAHFNIRVYSTWDDLQDDIKKGVFTKDLDLEWAVFETRVIVAGELYNITIVSGVYGYPGDDVELRGDWSDYSPKNMSVITDEHIADLEKRIIEDIEERNTLKKRIGINTNTLNKLKLEDV